MSEFHDILAVGGSHDRAFILKAESCEQRIEEQMKRMSGLPVV